jgi:hypothetical protein
MQVLAAKFGTDAHPANRVCDNYPSPITFYPPEVAATTTYSCNDQEMVDVTAAYNGTSTPYLSHIASTLTNISNFFPSVSSGDASTTDAINKLDTANDNSIFAQLHSPGDLRIEDGRGHTLGVLNGVVVNTFPFASYDAQTKSAHIFFPTSDDLAYKVTGTGTGVYGLDIAVRSGSRQITFHRDENVAITPGEVHTYTIDPSSVAEREKGVTLTIEKKGSDTANRAYHFNAMLTNITPPGLLSLPQAQFIPIVPPNLPVEKNIPHPAPLLMPYPSSPASDLNASPLELDLASSTTSSTQ